MLNFVFFKEDHRPKTEWCAKFGVLARIKTEGERQEKKSRKIIEHLLERKRAMESDAVMTRASQNKYIPQSEDN